MHDKRALTTYFLLVAAAGAAALAAALPTIRPEAIDPLMLAILLTLAAAAQRMPVFLFRSSAISISFAAVIASYVLYGTGIGVVVSLAQALVNAFTPKRKPLLKASFNAGSLAISAYLGAESYRAVGGQVPPGDIALTLLAVAASALVYFLANTGLTAAVIAISERQNLLLVWRTNYSWMPINFLATAAQGAALALASQALGVFGIVVFTLHLGVIGALIGALEAKENKAACSAAQTMYHAVAVSRSLGCTDDEIAQIKLGALFHDIGTIGVPEHLLRKPAALDDHEWAEVKAHPAIGANLLSNVPMLEKIRPIVLAHHEHYDGTGYPNGLREDQIPLAAQIIAVADAYQAMTSERPYREPMSRKDALRELRACAGTQFNPVVVEAFITTVVNENRHPITANEREHEQIYQQAIQAVRVAI